MRVLGLALGALALAAIAGCAVSGPPAAQSSPTQPTLPPLPTVTPSLPEFSGPPIPSDPPAPMSTYLSCGQVPVNSGSWWELQAIAPATCKQANDILRKALSRLVSGAADTIDGWSCQAGQVMSPGITCTKGQLELIAKLYS